MADVLNSSDLKEANRDIELPFEAIIRSGHTTHHLHAQSCLRFLPRKRMVVKGQLNDQTVVAKLFFGLSAKNHLEKELAGIDGFGRAQVDTPKVVLQGRIDPGGYCVVFEWLDNAETLGQQLKQTVDPAKEVDILRAMIGTIAVMHNSGIVQHDIHPSNFLNQGGSLKVIDGGDVSSEKIGNVVPVHVALDNLALLFGQLTPHYDQHIPVLAPVYADLRGWLPEEIRLPSLLSRVQRWRQTRLNKLLKKSHRDSTDFAVYEDDFSKGMIHRSFDSNAIRILLGNPDYVMSDSYVIKSGNTTTVAIAELDGIPIVIKRYNIRSLAQQVRWSLQMSRASRSWQGAHLLSFWDINTPNPIAYIEQWKGVLRGNSYFISEHVEGPCAYDVFADQCAHRQYDHELISAFVSLFDHWAMAQVSHGDCKATNFLIKDQRPWVLDLDSLTYHSSVSAHRKAFAKDIHRFLKNWDAFPGLHAIFSDQLSRYIF